MDIDSAIDSNEALLQASLERVNRKIAALIAKLEDDGGLMLADQLNLERALNMRVEIAGAYAEYNTAIESVVNTYTQAATNVVADLGVSFQFSRADTDLVNAMIADTRVQLLQSAIANAAEISNMTYVAVVSGASKEELILQTAQMLIGGTTKNGKPLVNYAKTIASTNYMSVNNVVNKRIGERMGVKKWKYTGTLITDSRPFCVERAGKVFTTEEVNGWNALSWGGKAGNVWTNCGGYRCRHSLRPFIETGAMP